MENYKFEVTALKMAVKRLENQMDRLIKTEQVRGGKETEGNEAKEKKYIDAYDVAEMFYTSVGTVYNWKYQGKIPFYKINGRLLFNKKEIEKIAASNSEILLQRRKRKEKTNNAK